MFHNFSSRSSSVSTHRRQVGIFLFTVFFLQFLFFWYFGSIASFAKFVVSSSTFAFEKKEIIVSPLPKFSTPTTTGAIFSDKLSAVSAVVRDRDTGMVLFEKEANLVRPMASITKLMSVLVLNDLALNFLATTTVSTSSVFDNHLERGQDYSVKDLWNTALIGSSNLAILSLVNFSGLSIEEFAAKMNAKARLLGMSSTNFMEPTGLSPNNVSTASEVAILLKEAVANSLIAKTLMVKEYSYHAVSMASEAEKHVSNTNWLLSGLIKNSFVNLRGGKTGFIEESGYNFATEIGDDKNHAVDIVIFGAATNEDRFVDAKKLGEWALKNISWVD